MVPRLAVRLVKKLARQFPAVLLLGPRQCGKTTLAREFLKGAYFDLEKPSDQQVFLGDPELAIRRLKEPLVLDEAQSIPALFPVLRAVIDEHRNRKGRFYLLGSVNPALARGISESLAGRVGIVELTPFLYREVKPLKLGLPEYWLKGGFPDACRERKAEPWLRWQEAYAQTFIERDLVRHGVGTSGIELRRFMAMLAHLHGGLLNASDLGRSMGLTYHTIQNYIDIFEAHYLTRRLYPYSQNVGKRLVKSPKIYVRDSGLLHYLLGISDERALLESPRRGFSWEGLLIEQLVARENLRRAGSRFWFYRTHAGIEVDFIIDRGKERTGFEFKCASSATPRDANGLKSALTDGIISKGYIVHMGGRRYPMADRIECVGAEELLQSPPV